MIVGACTWIYGDAPLGETLARIAAAGCDGVELPGEPDQFEPGEVRALLAHHRLAPVALTASCKAPETRRDLAHPDAAVRADAVAYVGRCLRFAAEIGAPLVQMLPSGESRLAPLAERDNEWRWSVEAMRTAAREAERLRVRLAVEPINRYETYLVTSVDAALAYLNAVGSPWLGLTLDLFHANIEERTIPGAIRAAGSALWHVHIADTNREGLGRGHLDLDACLAALREVRYEGALVLEMTAPGPDPFRPIKDLGSAGVVDRYLRESVARLREPR
ncbi:MAG TPA: sugar phosphate isomerase/epimerase family protein [bacterium]|nr:sugar phosphate isomerase/epimerase family protein [bacterium]